MLSGLSSWSVVLPPASASSFLVVFFSFLLPRLPALPASSSSSSSSSSRLHRLMRPLRRRRPPLSMTSSVAMWHRRSTPPASAPFVRLLRRLCNGRALVYAFAGAPGSRGARGGERAALHCWRASTFDRILVPRWTRRAHRVRRLVWRPSQPFRFRSCEPLLR